MLDSLADMTSRNADHLDLQRFSSVATLLLQGGCDECGEVGALAPVGRSVG